MGQWCTVRRTQPAINGLEDGRKEPWIKECGQPLQGEKGKETDSPGASRGNSAL